MNVNNPKQKLNAQKSLIIVSIVYLVNTSIGTTIAIHENLPSVTLVKSGLPAWEDFLVGFGTALSAPLVLCLALVVCIILALQAKRLGTIGVAGLVILSVFFIVGTFAETITYRVLAPATFDLPKALVVVAHIVLSLLMIGLGSWELARKRQASPHLSKQRAGESP